MSDSVDPAKTLPREALELAIGRYVMHFANLETIVATHIGYLLELDYKLVFFILKDAGFDQKVKLLRRTAQQKFPKKSEAYCALLNRADKINRARNNLLHGSFASDGKSSELRGRLGETLTNFDAGLQETGFADLQEASLAIDEVSAALISSLPELSDSPSSSSSLEEPGSGRQ